MSVWPDITETLYHLIGYIQITISSVKSNSYWKIRTGIVAITESACATSMPEPK